MDNVILTCAKRLVSYMNWRPMLLRAKGSEEGVPWLEYCLRGSGPNISYIGCKPFKTPKAQLDCRCVVLNPLPVHSAAWRLNTIGHAQGEELVSFSFNCWGPRERKALLPKIMHPKQPQFADVANFSPSVCNERPLLGGASLLIKACPSAR